MSHPGALTRPRAHAEPWHSRSASYLMGSMKYRAGWLLAVFALAAPACNLIFGVGDPRLKEGTGGSGGAGGGGASGGTGGSGAGGIVPVDPCADVDCVNENECTVRTCNAVGECAPEFLSGIATEQVPGDCKVVTCENGLLTVSPDPTDPQPSVPGLCFEFVCNADGQNVSQNLAEGTACGSSNGTCNADGLCSACATDRECGSNTICMTFTCEPEGCVATPSSPMTVIPAGQQTPGDCLSLVCSGLPGGILPVTVEFKADVPQDFNECTDDVCVDGVPTHDFVLAGKPCGADFCDGAGHCVECASNTNCVGDPQGSFCNADSACGCETASHCQSNPVGLRCLGSGICGCSSNADCPASLPSCNTGGGYCQPAPRPEMTATATASAAAFSPPSGAQSLKRVKPGNR